MPSSVGILQYGNDILLTIKGIASWKEKASLLIYSLHVFLVGINVCLIPIIFAYRYMQICDSKIISHIFSRRGAAVPIVMIISLNFYVAATFARKILFFYDKNVDALIQRKNILLLSFRTLISSDQVLSCSCMARRIFNRLSYLIFFSELVIAYVVVFAAGYKIIKQTRLTAKFNKTRALTTQLTTVMILQAAFPFLFMILPIIAFVALVITRVEVKAYGSLIICFFNWQMVFNPFISIYFVRPFRKRISALCKCGHHEVTTIPSCGADFINLQASSTRRNEYLDERAGFA